MSRPQDLKTRIFLDGGDPEETKKVIEKLGFLDGQTTNPTLISKNPEAAKRLAEGQKFLKEEIFDFYKQSLQKKFTKAELANFFYKEVVTEISGLIPEGSVSVEVYADANTTAEEMFSQGKDMYTWIPNAHVKYPTTKAGLQAAEKSIKEGIRVNMTLVFSQEQAAAVYAATKQVDTPGVSSQSHLGGGSLEGFKNVFVSPFIGRLDDRGENGMDVIKNILKMYQAGDGHMAVLTASVRNLDHLMQAIKLGSDIITVPFGILKEWGEKGLPIPDENYIYNVAGLKSIDYRKLDLEKPWTDFDITHDLTDKGIEKFSADWNALIQ